MRIVFLDTSAIVAAINQRDQHHFKAKQVLAELAKGQSSRRGRLAPVLSHHRTYRSVYGGSPSLTNALVTCG